MRRKPIPPPIDRRAGWQIDQGERCGCRGHDDLCACQNEEAPWKYGLADWPPVVNWQARAEAAEARLQALEAENRALREGLRWIGAFAAMRAKDDAETLSEVARGALRTIAKRALLGGET